MLYTMQYIVQMLKLMAHVDKIPSKNQSNENYVDKLTKKSHHSFSLKKSFFRLKHSGTRYVAVCQGEHIPF